MSRVLRGVIVYTFILAAAALVLGVFLFGVMFITSTTGKPFQVFGYRAIYTRNATSATEITTSDIPKGTILNLTIKAGNHKVIIKQAGDSTTNIIVQKSDSMVGIIKGYDGKIEKSILENEESGEVNATISVKNADGIVSYGESFLLVYVPDAKEFKVNLAVETVNGNILIDGSTKSDALSKIALNSLSVKTVKGNMEVKRLGSIITAEQADKGRSNATLTRLYLKTDSGYFNFSSVEKLRIISDPTSHDIGGDVDVKAPTLTWASGHEVPLIAKVNTALELNMSKASVYDDNGVAAEPVKITNPTYAITMYDPSGSAVASLLSGGYKWNYTQEGVYKLEIKVSDSVNNSRTYTYSIVVANETQGVAGGNVVVNETLVPVTNGNGVIEIDASAGDFMFKNVYAQMKVFGSQIRIEAGDIVTQGDGFKFNAPKGYLKIKSIFTVGNNEEVANVINTEVINIDIQQITGYTNIKTTMGSIKINTINGSATLQSRNGNITISEVVTGNMSAVTQFGNINVRGYGQAAYFESTKGDITATNTQAEGNNFLTEVKTNDGSVTLNGISGMLKLTVNGNGSAKVNFIDLVQNVDNLIEIVNTRGKINLVVKSSPFFLIAKGNVVGNVFTTDIANLVANQEGQKVSVLTTSASSPTMNVNAGSGKITFAYNIGE